MDEIIFLKDFYQEKKKLLELPFVFRNTLDIVEYDDLEKLTNQLLENNISYETAFLDEIKHSRFVKESHDLRYFEHTTRLNPIVGYECFQWFRLHEVIFHIDSPLYNYHSEIMFKLGFQINLENKKSLIQNEINKIFKKSNNIFHLSLLYNKDSRENLTGYVSKYEVISYMVADAVEYNEYLHTKPSRELMKVLNYVGKREDDLKISPLTLNLKKWRRFELDHYKLLYLRRIYKSIYLFDDFFNAEEIEINEPEYLSQEDRLFAGKIKLILKNEMDIIFILKLLRNVKERSIPFFHNLFQYLANSNTRISRFKVLGSSAYIKIVSNCYQNFNDFVISSNPLSDKWKVTFSMYDKK